PPTPSRSACRQPRGRSAPGVMRIQPKQSRLSDACESLWQELSTIPIQQLDLWTAAKDPTRTLKEVRLELDRIEHTEMRKTRLQHQAVVCARLNKNLRAGRPGTVQNDLLFQDVREMPRL